MKKTVSFILAALLAASTLASCSSLGERVVEGADPYRSSSSGYADGAWLASRLGEMPDNVTVGTADSLGIDMTSFESDGYFIRTSFGETVVAGKTDEGLDLAVRRYASQVKDGRVFDVTYHEGARIERLTVAGRDISEYTVAYTHDGEVRMPDVGKTTGNGEYAATEFVRLIKEATGIALPTVDLSTGAALPEHYVLFEADDSAFSVTGYEYKVEGGNLIFRGSGVCGGCSNGVYYFAEHILGWEGLAYGDASLREAEHIDIPADLYRKGEMTFEHFVTGHCDFDRLGTDRYVTYYGLYYHACHGMANNRFAGDDVDYVYAQPCLCDEYQYETIRDNVEAYIQRALAAGLVIGENFNYVDLAHADNKGWCSCKDCRKALKEDGSQSGPWLRMVNRVAEEMDEKHPGLRYLMFAYEDTKCPPAVTRPNENVSVTFCMDGNCYNHSLASGACDEATFRSGGKKNDTYAEWIGKWCDITEWVDIWYYAMDGAFAQYDIVDVLFEDVKFYQSLGIKGIYMEGQYFGMGTGRLNHELLPELQFEPDMTYSEYVALRDRYIERDYGEFALDGFLAAQDLIRTSARRAGCKTCWYLSDFYLGDADYDYMAAHMDEVLAGIDEMIEDAPSRTAELRAKRLSLCILYEGIVGRYVPAYKAGDEAELAALAGLYDLFYSRAVECGYNMNSFTLGIDSPRRIAPTLAEEGQIWLNAKYS